MAGQSVKYIFVSWLLCAVSLAAQPLKAQESFFIRSETESLDPQKLAELSFHSPKLSWFFLSELYLMQGKWDLSERYNQLLASSCVLPQLEGTDSLVCALYFGVQSGRSSPVKAVERATHFYVHLSRASDLGVSNVDRLYVEGRVFYQLPIAAGRDIGKSLLAFQMLARMTGASSAYFWLGEIYRKARRTDQAINYYKKAQTAGDVRAELYRENGNIRWTNEPKVAGSPGIFFTPQRGYGLWGWIEVPMAPQTQLMANASLALDGSYDSSIEWISRTQWLGGQHRWLRLRSKFGGETENEASQDLVQLGVFRFNLGVVGLQTGMRFLSERGGTRFGPHLTMTHEYDNFPYSTQWDFDLWASEGFKLRAYASAKFKYDLDRLSRLTLSGALLTTFGQDGSLVVGWERALAPFPWTRLSRFGAINVLRYDRRVWLGLELSCYGLGQWDQSRLGGGFGVAWVNNERSRFGLDYVYLDSEHYLQAQSHLDF